MATIVLSAAGAALGGSLGGSVLGLSSAVIGRAVGATLGRAIDQKLLGTGSQAVETGRIDRFRLTGASEGAGIGQVYGRMRIAGQVIWATDFLEAATTSGGGGKGAPSRPQTTEYSYSVSLAVALCEGVVSRVGRVWADGEEVDPDTLNMRVYKGTDDQLPDPKIQAVQGVENTPAFRGTAYVVMEDLALAPFGNRVPHFTFEVLRPSQGAAEAPRDLGEAVRAVAMIPGTGEYALATTPVGVDRGMGDISTTNVHTVSERTNFAKALDALTEELPRCGATSLVVSWFGDDLRVGECALAPRVEQTTEDGAEMPWNVSGLGRAQADRVPLDEGGRPLYGGTPTDASVIEAIGALRGSGQAVMFYPFILMTQVAGNVLPDPYSDATGQPPLPWRGRMTTSRAPGRPGTPDGTAAATAEVAAFLGTAQPSDFTVSEGRVTYSGPAEWSYRRFVLHYAHLCVAAGGVDAFCVGSEMRGLTQIRGAGNSFPFVAALRDLLHEVRAILGPDTKLSYAADWSEYFGYHPQDGSGDVFFHLDPFWADAECDFVGIDNYMPLSDWRDGADHLDAAEAASIYDVDCLAANVAGGEGYDWYYHSAQARDAQIRTPITDGAEHEPWTFRYKDLPGWWGNYHHDRVGGTRAALPTDWEPRSKPFWFTEYGCAAIDKGTNQPNKFLDPKSSESAIPHFSDGNRDELMQLAYARAFAVHYADPANNPVSEAYEGPMVDMDRAFLWAFDARPYPHFPALDAVWSDGGNYRRGHWLNGRTAGRDLASVVAEICDRAGLACYDVRGLHGYVRGYHVPDMGDARAALQPLMLAYGFDVVERDGTPVFFDRTGRADTRIDEGGLVHTGDGAPVLQLERSPEAETVGRVQVAYVDADADFETNATEAVFPDERTFTVSRSELNLSLTRSEGRRIAERWLAEGRVARDAARFALPPSAAGIGAGDVVRVAEPGGEAHYRIDRVEAAGSRAVEAVRIEPGTYDRPRDVDEEARLAPKVPLVAVHTVFLDLPLLRGDEVPHRPRVVATGRDWPGAVDVFRTATGAEPTRAARLSRPATLGVLTAPLSAGPLARYDLGGEIRVLLTHGALSSATEAALLDGANVAAIGDGGPTGWEVVQFRDATLVAPETYALRVLLRGQAGTEVDMPPVWPEGSTFVLLDGADAPLDVAPGDLGRPLGLRAGPAGRALDGATYRAYEATFAGLGRRPLRPVHLRKVREGGDVRLSWTRRTRQGGDPWTERDVPVGEGIEAYLVRIGTGTGLLRELTVTAPSLVYTAAERAADGMPAQVHAEVAQLSDAYGPGPFARIVL
ncbi:MAG: baseplate multidomain protein megatron [Shimia sp.]